jgi:AraC-like DNA-binding protein
VNDQQLVFCIDGAFVAAAAISILPVLYYLFTGWSIRRDKLFSYMSEDALRVYYDQFPWSISADKDLKARFTRQFSFLYGRRHFILPLVLFIGLVAGSFANLALTVQSDFTLGSGHRAISRIAVFALLGAFLWCVSDQLARIVRRDLSPRDVYSWDLRILLSVPFGFALAAIVKEDVGVPVAFFLGAFPTRTLFMIARRFAVQKLSMGDQSDSGRLELQQLQSISREIAETLQDDGIDTISALAWVDPIDLTIRTNLDFNYVLDCMSQALLWVYFQDRTRDLFRFSLRGSQESLTLISSLKGVNLPFQADQVLSPKRSQAKATLKDLATILGMSESSLMTTLEQVAADQYTQFIYRVWR